MSENLYSEFRRLTPKVTGGLVRMKEEAFRDAPVPRKYKILTALAIVVGTKCDYASECTLKWPISLW